MEEFKEKVLKGLDACYNNTLDLTHCTECPYNNTPNCLNVLAKDCEKIINNSETKNTNVKTRFDKITESPESLAEFLDDFENKTYCDCCAYGSTPFINRCNPGACRKGMVEWLNQPLPEETK